MALISSSVLVKCRLIVRCMTFESFTLILKSKYRILLSTFVRPWSIVLRWCVLRRQDPSVVDDNVANWWCLRNLLKRDLPRILKRAFWPWTHPWRNAVNSLKKYTNGIVWLLEDFGPLVLTFKVPMCLLMIRPPIRWTKSCCMMYATVSSRASNGVVVKDLCVRNLFEMSNSVWRERNWQLKPTTETLVWLFQPQDVWCTLLSFMLLLVFVNLFMKWRFRFLQ